MSSLYVFRSLLVGPHPGPPAPPPGAARPPPPAAPAPAPFVQAAKITPVDLRERAVGLMERDNRKSHLAPQLSPATQELLRSTDSPTFHGDDRTMQTPTSGEIPIVGALVSPRDQYDSVSNRSPTRNGLGRASGPAVHPGLERVATTSSIPQVVNVYTSADYHRGPSNTSDNTNTHPERPAPPAGPLPPPPPRKETPDELRERESRRQATFGPPANGGYNPGYPTK